MNSRQKLNIFTLINVLVISAACSSSTPSPTTMAGYWQGQNFIVSTIQEQNGNFFVSTVYDTEASHSQNLLISSTYSDGVLTWKYCPPAESCITAKTVSFNENDLTIDWTDDKGGSGQMILQRLKEAPNP